jgi:hypothetical protein
MKRGLLLISALLISLSAIAIDTGVAFEDPEMQARYENSTKILFLKSVASYARTRPSRIRTCFLPPTCVARFGA